MASRSTLTRVSGGVVTSAWANALRDHVVPFTTTDDVSSEGQLAVNTSTDRMMIHNGSGARRLTHYSAAGRTGATAQALGVAIGAGVTGQVPWSTTSDPDSYYSGWDGATYNFFVPSGLEGLYTITMNIFAGSAITTGGIFGYIVAGTLLWPGYCPPTTSWASVTVPPIPLAAGAKIYAAVENKFSASVNFDMRIYLYRTDA